MTTSREDQKERTRRAILDAALRLSEDAGLAGLSLRQVAREVGVVPTAFYRHFGSLDEVGLALVEESFASLRAMLRDVRRESAAPAAIIAASVRVLARHVADHREHFGFIARERLGGTPVVREAVRHQLELVERELAADLTGLAGPPRWSSEDVLVLANLVVGLMVRTVEEILRAQRPAVADAAVARAQQQLSMLVVGASHWRSR